MFLDLSLPYKVADMSLAEWGRKEIEVSEPEPELVIEQRVRMISDNINVRSGPGTDFDRLGSAYIGYDFEYVEQLEEWTKIVYDGQMAYVYSEYVEIIPMVLQEDGSYTERGNDVIRQTPFKRFGRPEELCGTIQYLISDAAAFVTGTVAVVDGGFNTFAM